MWRPPTCRFLAGRCIVEFWINPALAVRRTSCWRYLSASLVCWFAACDYLCWILFVPEIRTAGVLGHLRTRFCHGTNAQRTALFAITLHSLCAVFSLLTSSESFFTRQACARTNPLWIVNQTWFAHPPSPQSLMYATFQLANLVRGAAPSHDAHPSSTGHRNNNININEAQTSIPVCVGEESGSETSCSVVSNTHSH